MQLTGRASRSRRLAYFLDGIRRERPLTCTVEGELVRFGVPEPIGDDVIERNEALAFCTVMHVRALGGDDANPVAVTFAYDRESRRARYEAFFRCPVQFNGPATSLVFARALLDRRSKALGRKPAPTMKPICSVRSRRRGI